MMSVEVQQTKVRSKGVFVNPFIGDLSRDLVEAIHKCQCWQLRAGNSELPAVLHSWLDYVCENWNKLESGDYRDLKKRPLFNYK